MERVQLLATLGSRRVQRKKINPKAKRCDMTVTMSRQLEAPAAYMMIQSATPRLYDEAMVQSSRAV